MNARCVLVLALITVLLLGCNDDTDDLQAYVANVRQQAAPKLKAIPEIKHFPPYVYAADGRRSPFTAVIATPDHPPTSHSGLRPDPDRPLEPLEKFPLDALSMVGSITVNATRYALIHAPDGVVHRTPVGAHAGQDYGEITAINSTRIQLSEIVPDGRGGFMRHPASIPLSQ